MAIINVFQANRIRVDYLRYYQVTGSLGFDPDGLRWRYSVYTVRIKDIGSPDNMVFPQTSKENQGLSDHMLTNPQYIIAHEAHIKRNELYRMTHMVNRKHVPSRFD